MSASLYKWVQLGYMLATIHAYGGRILDLLYVCQVDNEYVGPMVSSSQRE